MSSNTEKPLLGGQILDCDAGSQGDDARTTDPCQEKLMLFSGPQGEVPVTQNTESVPMTFETDTNTNESASLHSPPYRRRSPGVMTLIGYFILRVTFILAALVLLSIGGLYAFKFCGFYDPCEQFYVTTSECSITPYLKGMLQHVDCTEEKHCLLPGFLTSSSKKDWTVTLTSQSPLKPSVAIESESSSTGT